VTKRQLSKTVLFSAVSSACVVAAVCQLRAGCQRRCGVWRVAWLQKAADVAAARRASVAAEEATRNSTAGCVTPRSV
jgi:hypothetical protein